MKKSILIATALLFVLLVIKIFTGPSATTYASSYNQSGTATVTAEIVGALNYIISSYPSALLMIAGDAATLPNSITFRLTSVTNTSIAGSLNTAVSLSTGGSQKFDSNSDGTYDVQITFNSINYIVLNNTNTTRANITFSSSSGAVSEEVSLAAGGGGGGVAAIEKKPEIKKIKKDFEVSPQLIKITAREGDEEQREIKIKNTGNVPLNFSLYKMVYISEFVSLSENKFALKPEEEKIIKVDFSAKQIGVQTGKIIIESEAGQKEVKIILEVETEAVIFEMNMDVPSEFTQVPPGENITVFITLKNFKKEKIEGLELEYLIKDMENNIVFSDREFVDVETQGSFSRKVQTLPSMRFGDYVLIVQAKYQGTLALSTKLITIMEKAEVEEIMRVSRITYYLMIILIVIGMIIVGTLQIRHRIEIKKVSKMKAEDIRKLKTRMRYKERADIERNKNIIESKIKLLEDAYKRGYITEKSLTEGKRKLRKLVGKKQSL